MTRLEDLKYARPDRTVPSDGATRAMATGKRRRRARYAVATSVVLIVALFVSLESALVSHSSSAPPAKSPKPVVTPKPTLYTAVGSIEGYPKTNPHYCLGGDLGSSGVLTAVPPDPCSYEVQVRNFDPSQIPMIADGTTGTRSKGTVRVTGTYADGVLTLTKTPVAAKPAEPDLNFPLPCPTPAGGWHGSDPVNVSIADQAVMGRFSAAHPTTFGGYWIARAPTPVIVAGVTGDVAGAQRELSGKLQGSVCVTKVAHTDRYLTQVSAQITALEKVGHTPFLSGWGPDAVTSTVVVGVRVDDPATVDYFAAHFPPGVIKLKPFLKRLP
jgi:hypothetical protein